MTAPVACTAPKCDTPSLFSTVGLVDGRFESQCLRHALRQAKREHATATARLDALTAVEVPGQLSLVP